MTPPANQDESPPGDPATATATATTTTPPETTPKPTQPTKNETPTTPANKRASAPPATTPKSAPAAAGHGSSAKKKPEPSLLTDFLLGRPSPARIAAQRERQRRKSMAADAANVREELRQEMRAAAMRRVQQPGGVRERVLAWQKASAAAMKEQGGGVPHAEDAMTEPTEVAVQVPAESVTETDRLRVRMRARSKRTKPKAGTEDKENQAEGDGNDGDGEETEREAPAAKKPDDPHVIKVKLAPKKRIVSDDNWMKRNNNSGKSPVQDPPKANPTSTPTPIPKDFLKRTAQNPSVQSKIRDWVQRVEMPDPPPPQPKPKPQPRKKADKPAPAVVEEYAPSVVASDPGFRPKPKPQDDGIRVKPKPLEDDGIRVKPKPLPDDGIRVKPMKPKKPAYDSDDGIRVRPVRKKESVDDGIRVKAVDPSKTDDGIRVRPIDPNNPDGIRVRPMDLEPTEKPEARTASPKPEPPKSATPKPEPSTSATPKPEPPKSATPKAEPPKSATPKPAPPRSASPKPASPNPESARPKSTGPKPRVASARRKRPSKAEEKEPSEVSSETVSSDTLSSETETETEVETRPKRKPSRRRRRRRSRSHSPAQRRAPSPKNLHSESEAVRRAPSPVESDTESERTPPTVLGNKSLAEIPFGYSAFSVLDLPLGPDEHKPAKRPKAARNPSLKAVPKVLKKVVTGAKDIIQEMAEPPRPPPTTNKPQSIETWLNNTVDPFVEPAAIPTPLEPANNPPVEKKEPMPEPPKVAPEPPKQESSKREPAPAEEPDTHKRAPSRSAPEARPRQRQPSSSRPESRTKERAQPKPAPEARPEEATLHSALRNVDSREKEDSDHEDSDVTPRTSTPATPSAGLKRRRATRKAPNPKSRGKKPFRELLRDAFRGESGGHTLPPTVYPSCETDYESSDYNDDETDTYYGPTSERSERRRSGGHRKEGSVSDHSSAYYSSTYYSSAYDTTIASSDLSSHPPPRRRPPTNGVHELSTIISEESTSTRESETLSDASQSTVTQATAFTKSTEVTRQKSQKTGLKRRLTKHSDLVSVLSLPDDGPLAAPSRSQSIRSTRSLHRRPSKTSKGRVDDLLDEFADDEHWYGREMKALMDGVIPVLLRDIMNDQSRDARADAMAKAVVNMGMALEKLRDQHRRVPVGDIRALFIFLEEVSPLYDHYLDVWRLGFQGIIINLAPRSGKDDDSLVNALPRNEAGDIVKENGERVDVAFLFKRPLVRIKWIVKFLKAALAVTEAPEAERLITVFSALQEKARKRHKEETARLMDEDASNTDTSKCRDLRTLLPLDGVVINRRRQVVALDVFSLDLHHSSDQRLECQVEMIFRDRPALPADKGDVLIREVGIGSRSWLLFPPVPMQYISARHGKEPDTLLVMIRGTHNGKDWFELLNLSTDSEEQIEYWLRVLGSDPMPPLTRPLPSAVQEVAAKPPAVDVPVGERKSSVSSVATSDGEPLPPSPCDNTRPSAWPANASPESTPGKEEKASQEEQRPPRGVPAINVPGITKAPPNTTPFREDGAPPPPIHRTLGPKSPGLLAPPIETGPHARLKRRTSSPLKHEYHPSDVSSESSCSVSDDGDDDEEETESSESSSDDLDEDEVPDTIPGYSIKESKPPAASAESMVSDNSITPSHSASQVAARGSQPERQPQLFTSTVSYWSSRRGMWKDIHGGQPVSIAIYPGSMEVRPSTESEPLISLVLTPVVMIRRSTALDLEVRCAATPESRLKTDATMFRFRATNQAEAKDLYEAVHFSRLNNATYIRLSEEARVRSFGQMQSQAPGEGSIDGDSSSRRRTWFGRRNSYRASTRAPSVSQGSISTTISAGSFLRRLMGGNSYNIDESTLDRTRPISGSGSLYTTSSGGSPLPSGYSSPPRSSSASQSASQAGSSRSRWSIGNLLKPGSTASPFEIRCHLNVPNNRWLDKGDCILHIARPPAGAHQELPLYRGLEKRIIVTHATRKVGDKPLVILDAVLGSQCFSFLGRKGIMCSVFETVKDEQGNVGVAPRNGGISGKVTKWCFQCKSEQHAAWVMGLLTAEVPGLVTGEVPGVTTEEMPAKQH